MEHLSYRGMMIIMTFHLQSQFPAFGLWHVDSHVVEGRPPCSLTRTLQLIFFSFFRSLHQINTIFNTFFKVFKKYFNKFYDYYVYEKINQKMSFLKFKKKMQMQRGRVDAKAPPQTFYRLKAPQSAQTPSLEYLSDSHTLLNILLTLSLSMNFPFLLSATHSCYGRSLIPNLG
jgi:hypothetical protein